MLDQLTGGFPGVLFGLAHDHMQAYAELHSAPVAHGAFTHIREFFGDGGRRFAPGQVHIDLLGGEVMGGIGRTTEIQRRIRLLHRRVKGLGVLYAQVFAFKIYRLALQYAAPDL